MLVIKHIYFSHGYVTVYHDASFTAKRGQLTVVKGESGSGKTTLLDLLSLKFGVHFDLSFDDEKIVNKKQYQSYLQNIYYMTQNPLFCNDLTIEQQWKVLMEMYGDNHIDEYISLLGLKDKQKLYPLQLSGGEKLRVSLINALIIHPHIVLLDEPTASLNDEYKEKVIMLLNKLKENSILIVASHDQHIINNCDVLYEIENQQLVRINNNQEDSVKMEKNIKNDINWVKYFFMMKRHHMIKEILTVVILSFAIAVTAFSVNMDSQFISAYQENLANSQSNRMLVYKAIDSRYPIYSETMFDEPFPITNTEYTLIEQIEHVENIIPKYILFVGETVEGVIENPSDIKITTDSHIVFDSSQSENIDTFYVEGIADDILNKCMVETFNNKGGVYINEIFLERQEIDSQDLKNCTITFDVTVPVYDVAGQVYTVFDTDDSYQEHTDDEFVSANIIEGELITLSLPVSGIISSQDTDSLIVNGRHALYLSDDYISKLIEKYAQTDSYDEYYFDNKEIYEVVPVDNYDDANVIYHYTPWLPNVYTVITDSAENARAVYDELTAIGFTVNWSYTNYENYGLAIINSQQMRQTVSLAFLVMVVILLSALHFIRDKDETYLNQWLYDIGYKSKKSLWNVKMMKYLINTGIVFAVSLVILYFWNYLMLQILHNQYPITLNAIFIISGISIFTQIIVPMIWEVNRYAHH